MPATPVVSQVPQVPQVPATPTPAPISYNQILEKYKAEELAQIQPSSGGGAQAEALMQAEQRAQKETGYKPEVAKPVITPKDIQQRQEEQTRSGVVTAQISGAFERRAARPQVDETSDEFKTLKKQTLAKKLEEEKTALGRNLLPGEQADLESQAVEEVRKIIESKSEQVSQVQAPTITPQAQDVLPNLIDRLKSLSRKIENPDEKTIIRLENITRMLQEKDYETASAAITRLEKQIEPAETGARNALRQRFESISGSGRSSQSDQRRSSLSDGSYQVASASPTTMSDATYVPESSKSDLTSSGANRSSFMNTITSVQQTASTQPVTSTPSADGTQTTETKSLDNKPENVRVSSTANVDRVDQDLLGRFYAAAKEYGKPVTINSGFRDDEKQAELWVRANVFREPGIFMPAKPDKDTTITYKGQTFNVPGGRARSSHGGSSSTANAIDISRADADAMDSMGLFAKYGLNRPFPNDPVHIQKIGGSSVAPTVEAATPQEVQATQVKSGGETTATGGTSGESDAEGGVATPVQGPQSTATGGATGGTSGSAATMTPSTPSSGPAALTASVGNEVAKRTPIESAPPISPETPSAPNAGAGDTNYTSSTSEPGNVEPADAAIRYKELFGLMAA